MPPGAHPIDIRNALKGHPCADQMAEIIGPEPVRAGVFRARCLLGLSFTAAKHLVGPREESTSKPRACKQASLEQAPRPSSQEPEAPAAAAEEKEAPKGIPSLGKPKKKEEAKA